MNEDQALNLISQQLNSANLKGVFTLSDSANIVTAIQIIAKKLNEGKQEKSMDKALPELESKPQSNKK